MNAISSKENLASSAYTIVLFNFCKSMEDGLLISSGHSLPKRRV